LALLNAEDGRWQNTDLKVEIMAVVKSRLRLNHAVYVFDDPKKAGKTIAIATLF